MTTTYKMTTKDSTRIRPFPNTGSAHIGGVPAGVTVTGVELFTATQPLSNSAGTYQLPGDQWLKITYYGVEGWVARIHMGKEICINFTSDGEVPPPEPPPPPAMSSQYIVTVDEATKRVIVKRGDGQPMADWTAVIG